MPKRHCKCNISPAQLATEIEKAAEEVKKDPEKRKELLVRAGIYTEDGELTEPYRTPTKERKGE